MSEAALKPEKDFSKEADQQIAESEKLAKVFATRMGASAMPEKLTLPLI